MDKDLNESIQKLQKRNETLKKNMEQLGEKLGIDKEEIEGVSTEATLEKIKEFGEELQLQPNFPPFVYLTVFMTVVSFFAISAVGYFISGFLRRAIFRLLILIFVAFGIIVLAHLLLGEDFLSKWIPT
jgi:hypothetical protein